jgi:23S rRNA pseudouridine1911/1915/1917 synthase
MAEQQSDQSHPFYEEKQIVVDPGQSPIRLDKFLGDRLENVSRNKIQNALKALYDMILSSLWRRDEPE